MTIRKIDKQAQDIRDRINEYSTVRMFLNQNKNELLELEQKLRGGDVSVTARIKELFDLIDEKNAWIKANLPLIKTQLAS